MEDTPFPCPIIALDEENGGRWCGYLLSIDAVLATTWTALTLVRTAGSHRWDYSDESGGDKGGNMHQWVGGCVFTVGLLIVISKILDGYFNSNHKIALTMELVVGACMSSSGIVVFTWPEHRLTRGAWFWYPSVLLYILLVGIALITTWIRTDKYGWPPGLKPVYGCLFGISIKVVARVVIEFDSNHQGFAYLLSRCIRFVGWWILYYYIAELPMELYKSVGGQPGQCLEKIRSWVLLLMSMCVAWAAWFFADKSLVDEVRAVQNGGFSVVVPFLLLQISWSVYVALVVRGAYKALVRSAHEQVRVQKIIFKLVLLALIFYSGNMFIGVVLGEWFTDIGDGPGGFRTNIGQLVRSLFWFVVVLDRAVILEWAHTGSDMVIMTTLALLLGPCGQNKSVEQRNEELKKKRSSADDLHPLELRMWFHCALATNVLSKRFEQVILTFKPGPMGIECDKEGFVEDISSDGQAQATYTFDPESVKKLGIECDADGRVTRIFDRSQAKDKDIKTGYRIVKVESVEYSQDELTRARHGNAVYRLTFEVRYASCISRGYQIVKVGGIDKYSQAAFVAAKESRIEYDITFSKVSELREEDGRFIREGEDFSLEQVRVAQRKDELPQACGGQVLLTLTGSVSDLLSELSHLYGEKRVYQHTDDLIAFVFRWDKHKQGHSESEPRERTLIVAFRGTKFSLSSPKNLIVDGRCSLVESRDHFEGRIHRGFLNAYKGLLHADTPLMEYLNELLAGGNFKEIQFVGHSLGGALAALNAAHFIKNSNFKDTVRVSLCTFGCPRIGDGPFNESLEKLFIDEDRNHLRNRRMFRIMHYDDLVPNLPPRWNLGLLHRGYTHPYRIPCLKLHPKGFMTKDPLLVEEVLDVLLSWNAWRLLKIAIRGAELYQTHMTKQYMRSLNTWWQNQEVREAAEADAWRTATEQEAADDTARRNAAEEAAEQEVAEQEVAEEATERE